MLDGEEPIERSNNESKDEEENKGILPVLIRTAKDDFKLVGDVIKMTVKKSCIFKLIRAITFIHVPCILGNGRLPSEKTVQSLGSSLGSFEPSFTLIFSSSTFFFFIIVLHERVYPM